MSATTNTLGVVPPADGPAGRFAYAVRGIVHLSPEHTQDFLLSLAQALTAHTPLPAFPSGKYAIAIGDTTTQAVYLASDWLGSEPLYYAPAMAPEGLCWAFELTTLARRQAVRRVDLRALDEFFTYHWINEDRSMLQGIARVLPGRVIAWTPDHGLKEYIHTRRSYTLANAGDTLQSAQRKTGLALHRYLTALREQHDRVAVFLSGGVDSSLLLALCREHFDHPIAITAQYVGHPNPELERARRVAERLGVEHQVIHIEPQYLHAQLPALTRMLEMPITYINNFVRLAMVQRLQGQVPLVLTGEGADGMFGTEVGKTGEVARLRERRRLFDKMPRPARAVLRTAYAALRPGAPTFEVELKQAVRRIGEGFRGAEQVVQVLRLERKRRQGYFYDFIEHAQDDLQTLRRDRGLFTQNRHQLYCYTRIAAAHGMLVDSPFLSDPVADIGLALPLALRADARDTKPILRRLLLEHLEEDIVYAPKMGFETPFKAWLDGALSVDFAMLGDRITRQRGFYDMEALQRMDDPHMRWALLALEVFCREFVDQSP